ncbi:UrcA family protein [Phenylobacterium sp.]|uniref:UrcA family protein n=1 Tax=Phenylobacterium sp. TaxID=1871053 RepID=UPI0035AEF0CC
MKTVIAIASTLALAAAAQAAQAADPSAAPKAATVAYADLDLASASGRATLERRIEHAVRQVCPAQPMPMEIAKQGEYRACRDVAWNGARRQLASLYAGPRYAELSLQVSGSK